MNEIVKRDASLSSLVENLNTTQRQYICLRLAGFEGKDACQVINRRPATIDRYLVDPNFRELEEFIVANKAKYGAEAQIMWSQSISGKAKALLEQYIEAGLDEIRKEDRDTGFLRLAMQAATTLYKLNTAGSGGGEPHDFEEFVLRKHVLT